MTFELMYLGSDGFGPDGFGPYGLGEPMDLGLTDLHQMVVGPMDLDPLNWERDGFWSRWIWSL